MEDGLDGGDTDDNAEPIPATAKKASPQTNHESCGKAVKNSLHDETDLQTNARTVSYSADDTTTAKDAIKVI